MSTFTENINQTFCVVTCYTCDVPFGITSGLYRRVVTKAEGSVYCPACGKETVWCESDDAKSIRGLKQQLKTERRRTATAHRRADMEEDRRNAAENSRRATKGAMTKLKKRVGNGVCPCCNRTFKDLARHMGTQHPDYAGESDS